MDKEIAKKQDSKNSDGKAIASLVLGILSLTGFGLLTGVPAIILAAVALTHKTPSRGLGLAGLVTGIIGTAFSILVVAFFLFMLMLSASQPGPVQLNSQGSSVDQPIYYQNR